MIFQLTDEKGKPLTMHSGRVIFDLNEIPIGPKFKSANETQLQRVNESILIVAGGIKKRKG